MDRDGYDTIKRVLADNKIDAEMIPPRPEVGKHIGYVTIRWNGNKDVPHSLVFEVLDDANLMAQTPEQRAAQERRDPSGEYGLSYRPDVGPKLKISTSAENSLTFFDTNKGY